MPGGVAGVQPPGCPYADQQVYGSKEAQRIEIGYDLAAARSSVPWSRLGHVQLQMVMRVVSDRLHFISSTDYGSQLMGWRAHLWLAQASHEVVRLCSPIDKADFCRLYFEAILSQKNRV